MFRLEFYQKEETNLLRRIVNWVVDVVVVIAIAWFTVYAFGTQIPVSGNSMQPVLESGNVVLMNRIIYNFTNPKRFDVVIFQREDEKMNMKRIIGLPGETVQIKDGVIFVDDSPLDTEERLSKVSLAGLAENPVILSDNEYFLLGDNRDSSEDSRFVNIGNVNRRQILGKVWIRIFPVVDLGLID